MLDGWQFSKHALQRALEMAVEPAELQAALLIPEDMYESKKYPGCHVYVSGRLALPVNPETRVVITVLWHVEQGGERYTRDLDEDLKRIRDPE